MSEIVVTSSDEVFVRRDGARCARPHWHLPPELYARVREGRRCPECQHEQPFAMPRRCHFGRDCSCLESRDCDCDGSVWRCGVRIRDELARILEREYRGEEDLSPPDAADVLDDERDYWRPHPLGIVVPRSLRPGGTDA